MSRRAWPSLPLGTALVLLLACSAVAEDAGGAPAPPPVTAAASAPDLAVALRWSELVRAQARRERFGPVVVARLIGYYAVAVHEAALPAMPGEVSLAGRLNGLAPVPAPAPGTVVDGTLALNAAAARILRLLLPSRGETARAVAAMEVDVAAQSRVPQDVAKASARYGASVADAVAAWASKDGLADMARRGPRDLPKEPGRWVPTPPDFRQAPLQPWWGELRPMALAACSACATAPPIPYSEDASSEFHRQAVEVEEIVRRQDPAEQEIALYWADDPAVTATPPGHWLAILDQLARDRSLPIARYLDTQAVLGVALSDAFIACWHAKFGYDYIRPVTYIQAHLDASWVPLLPTPTPRRSSDPARAARRRGAVCSATWRRRR